MKRNFVSLGEISEIMGGYAFKSSMMSDEPKKYQIIKMSNLYRGVLDLSRSPSFWENVDSKTERYLLKENDILMTLTGTVGKRDYGYTVQLKNENNLLLNQRVCCIRPRQKKVHTFYLFQYLRTQEFLNKFFDCSIGGTGNQSNVGISDLRELDIYLPPSTEQKAISDLLSTWDEAIERTERLIQAKEKRLNAYARNLFDPVKNAKFDDWKTIKLKTVLTEHSNKSTGLEEVYSVSVHKGLVNQIKHLGRSFSAANTDNYNCVHCGDIVYTKSPTGDFPLGIVKQSYVEKDVIVSPLYGVFAPVAFNLGIVLDLYFSSPIRARNYLFSIVQKGAKNTIAVTNEAFLSRSLRLPVTKAAQKVIAEFVKTSRKEISLLKQLAKKYETQKRGLMQKMLTGKWRVRSEIISQGKGDKS
ncbi:restriction endonuclease subunit S [Desulfosarcina sp. OttesenSCG-928-G10]|nr:restriction endonuclease subunit S [Desulfosarcina sp. OttesenSCG-928-G10]